MAGLLASVRQTTSPRAIRAVLHGPPGLGKTTMAAGAPDNVFIQTEDGAGLLRISTFGPMKSYSSTMDCVSELYTEPHDYRTLVVDSLDWLEPLVWEET